MGTRNNHTHTLSRINGKKTWNIQKKRCASTGHPGTTKRRCKEPQMCNHYFRQLVRQGQEEKHSGNRQNEILETCV